MAAENDVIQFLDARLAAEVERREQAEADLVVMDRSLAEVKQESARVVALLHDRERETHAGAGEAWQALDAMVRERDAALARAEEMEANWRTCQAVLERWKESQAQTVKLHDAALARAREAEAETARADEAETHRNQAIRQRDEARAEVERLKEAARELEAVLYTEKVHLESTILPDWNVAVGKMRAALRGEGTPGSEDGD